MASLVKLGAWESVIIEVMRQCSEGKGEAYRANILKRCTINGEGWDAAL